MPEARPWAAAVFTAVFFARRFGGDSKALAFDLLERAGVAVTPGVDFGQAGEGWLRFSYAASEDAPPGSILIGQFTTGGCIHVCETLPMCKDAHTNEKTGDCRLAVDRRHADFLALIKTCPGSGNRTFNADLVGGKWQVTCSIK